MKRPLSVFVAASLALCAVLSRVCLAGPVTYHFPYLDKETGVWVTESRQVPNDPAAVINSLLAGPASPDLYTPFPAGTRLLRAILSDGVLRLDFSEEFERYVDNNDVKMSHAIRETAFQIPGVTAVEVLVEGRTPRKGPHVEFDQGLKKPESQPDAPARPPLEWRLTNPSPWNDDLRDVIFAQGRFVAVGAGGAVLASTDGSAWTVHLTGTPSRLNSIAFAGGVYVAVGGGFGTPPVVLSSNDAITWTQRVRLESGEIRCVAYGNGRFVALGGAWEDGAGKTFTSSNGSSWVVHYLDTGFARDYVTFIDGRFLALGDDRTIRTSTEGLEWQSTPVNAESLSSVIYGNGRYVAVGLDSSRGSLILTSADGVAWERIETDPEPGPVVDPNLAGYLYDVAYGDGRFAAVGNHGTILTSTDGVTWKSRASGTDMRLLGVAHGNGVFVAVGEAGTILISRDGEEWTPSVEGTVDFLLGVAHGSGRFVAAGGSVIVHGLIIGSPTARVVVSEDAVSWTTRECGLPGSLNEIVYGGGRFVALHTLGRYGAVLASRDGVTWSNMGAPEPSAGIDHTYSAVAWGRRRLVVADRQGVSLLDPEGGGWVRSPSADGLDLESLAYGKNRFVGLAGDPRTNAVFIVSSPDGSHWTAQPSSLESPYGGIAYGDGLFVAVGGKGGIMTSDDDVTWTERESGTDSTLCDVAYGRGMFVAVGDAGTILTSTDGVTWTRNESGTSLDLRAVAYGKGRFVAVGANSTILTADTGEGVFSDVPVEHPAGDAVEFLAGRGVVSGLPDGTFRLDSGVSRGELAKMLVLAAGLKPDPGATISYSDVQEHWSVEQGYLQAATAAGALSGYPDGTFRPDGPVTRAELVKAVAAMAGLRPGGESSYADVQPADWFAGWVASAVDAGIIGYGWPWEVFTGETFQGNQPVTRAETALAVSNLVEWARDWER